MQGKLGGTGKLVILPVDQGFEHGPARSFAPNAKGYDPHYHFQLAVDAGLSAYAAPLGMIEAGAESFAGAMPTILKCNSANSLATEKDQAVTASVNDALRLGCCAIGFTIYPGSEYQFELIEEIRELAEEAKSVGLAVVVWSYPRGGTVTKEGETAMDVCAYAAHMAALIGAHIIKVKPPTDGMFLDSAKKIYQKENIPIGTLTQRISMSSSVVLMENASLYFQAARPRISTASTKKLQPSATVAATGLSLAAIPSNAQKKKLWQCLIILSRFTRTKPKHRHC